MRRIVRGWLAVPGAARRLLAQERTLPVPPNVTVDGVPAIPMSLVPGGRALRAVPAGVRLVAWHPTERRMIGDHDVRQRCRSCTRSKFPGGARTQLTFFRDGVSPRPGAVFLPRGQSFVFQKDTAGGGEANQLFRYDLRTRRDDPPDRRQVAQRHSGDLALRARRLRLDARATARIATST